MARLEHGRCLFAALLLIAGTVCGPANGQPPSEVLKGLDLRLPPVSIHFAYFEDEDMLLAESFVYSYKAVQHIREKNLFQSVHLARPLRPQDSAPPPTRYHLVIHINNERPNEGTETAMALLSAATLLAIPVKLEKLYTLQAVLIKDGRAVHKIELKNTDKNSMHFFNMYSEKWKRLIDMNVYLLVDRLIKRIVDEGLISQEEA